VVDTEKACHAGTPLAYTHCVQRLLFLVFLTAGTLISTTVDVKSAGLSPSRDRFFYSSFDGSIGSARIMRRSWRMPVVHPDATVDSRLDPRLRRAASIAQDRAHARSKARCWRAVKEALVASGVISSYPKTNYGSQAGEELVRNFGFKRLPVHNEFAAPLGSVLVYGRGTAGHVAIRTKSGFVSDYWTRNRCKYRLTGVYAKFGS
jgi:hypothetical protein